MSGRSLVGSIASSVLARVVAVALAFAGTVISSRALGPAGRGDYFFVLVISSMLVQFGNFGLHTSNTYLIAKNPACAPRLWHNALILSLGLGTAVAMIILVALHALPEGFGFRGNYNWWIVIIAPQLLLFLLGSNLMLGVGKIDSFNLITLLANVMLVAAMGGAALSGLGTEGFVAVTAAMWVAANIVLVLMNSVQFGRPRLTFDLELLRCGASMSLKAYGICILGFLLARGCMLPLRLQSTSEQVGQFSVALQCVEGLTLFSATMAQVLLPRLLRQERDAWSITVNAVSAIAVIFVIVAAVSVFWGPEIFSVVFGRDYTPAATVFNLMLPGALSVGAMSILSQFMTTKAFPTSYIVIVALGTLLTHTTAFAAAVPYGANGVAVCFSFGNVLTVFGVWWAATRHVPYSQSLG